MEEETNYMKFRGKCRGMCVEACNNDKSLTLVRGHYFCPIWNKNEQHWWTVREDGSIYDPTCKQFPSSGMGVYTPFNGYIECSQCGKLVSENEARFEGRYAYCSYECHGKFIGVF